MKQYQNIYTNEIFGDEDAAREDVWQEMTWQDYEDYFYDKMDFHEFFTRVRESMPEKFYEMFENEFCDAENEYFEQNYKEIEVEEKKDEEE